MANESSTKMREQGGIVQRSHTRHFSRTEKKSLQFKSQPSDQSNERICIISRFHNAGDNEKILKVSRERKPINAKE